MSLHNWNNLVLPSTLEVVTDNEFYFINYTIDKLDNNATRLLRYIDKAKYVDDKTFIDQFGYSLYWSNLSTGGKTILNVYYNPEICFDCVEAGDNAHASINSMITNGNVINCMFWVLGPDYTNIDIMKGSNDSLRYLNIVDYTESNGVIGYGNPTDTEEGEWY